MKCPSCGKGNQSDTLKCSCGHAFSEALAIEDTKAIPVRNHGPILGLIAACIVVIVVLQLGALLMPSKWEYQIVSYKDSELQTSLAAMGESGWEIASARRAIEGDKSGVYEFIMKRRK